MDILNYFPYPVLQCIKASAFSGSQESLSSECTEFINHTASFRSMEGPKPYLSRKILANIDIKRKTEWKRE